MPSTKPFRSATWASTLFAWITSARAPSATRRAASVGVEELGDRAGCRAPRRPARCCAPARCRAPARRRAVVLEQVAVVARDLDDEAVVAEAAFGDRAASASSSACCEHRVRERREVEVVAEQLSGGTVSVIWTSEQPRQKAEVERDRSAPVRRAGRSVSSALASGVCAEREDRMQVGRAARAARVAVVAHVVRPAARCTRRSCGAGPRRG